MRDAHDIGHDPLSRRAKWTVHQCSDGCVHIRLQNVTLTFSPRDFAQLVEMLGDAYVRLGVRATVASLAPQ